MVPNAHAFDYGDASQAAWSAIASATLTGAAPFEAQNVQGWAEAIWMHDLAGTTVDESGAGRCHF